MPEAGQLRVVPAEHCFTISHVHCPAGEKAALFEKWARWLLPRCRALETANGQVSEHLFRGKESRGQYKYDAASSGYAPRNMDRAPHLDARRGGTVEYVWFEEWRAWSGIEAHGGTAHGGEFHRVVDEFVEEEWTFYRPPPDWAQHAGDLPQRAAAAFLSGGREDMCDAARERRSLVVTHARLPAAGRAGFLRDAAGFLSRTRATAGNAWAVLVENVDAPSTFAMVSEWVGEAALYDWPVEHWYEEWGKELAAFLTAHRADASAARQCFGGAMWPADARDIRELGAARPSSVKPRL